MLEFHHIQPDFDRRTALSDAKDKTWLVADLEHKQWLQDSFFDKESWLSEDRVLRANELWLKLLSRQQPDLNIVSPMFLDSFIKQWLPRQKISWAHGESAAGILKDYLDFFLPLLVNESSHDLVRSWLQENTSAFLRWGNWFELSIALWVELCRHKFILAKWAPAYILALEKDLIWEQALIVDLGPDLTIVEAQLLQNLAKNQDVKLLIPDNNWRQRYSRALWPYQYLLEESLVDKDAPDVLQFPEAIQCKRYVTQLAEVRACVSQIRNWLDEGVAKDLISVVIADPEEYWPVLGPYFEREGIAVAKHHVCVAHSIPTVARWLSQLRIRSRPLSSEDYEASLFSKMTQPMMSYQKFRSLLSNIYSEDDLERLGGLQKSFESDVDLNKEIYRDEFIAWAIQFWDLSSDSESLRQIMSTVLLETPAHLQLNLASWNSYVQSVAGKTEIRVKDGQSNGIQIRKLSSVFFSKESYQFYLGHSDRALDESLSISVSSSDVTRLGQDIGYLLARPEPGKGQMLTDWALRSPKSQCIMAFSQTNFSGDAQGPSLLWLQLAKSHGYGEEVETRFSCRWDEIQEQDFEQLQAGFGDKTVILEDVGEKDYKKFPLVDIPSLSASKLEDYMDCPFKFTASKVFGLQSEPEVDLDLDRLRRGSLLHKCFEIILDLGLEQDWNKERLEQVIREARIAEGIHVPKSMWPLQVRATLEVLERFLKFERSWRIEYPQTQTIAREIPFEGMWQGHKFSGKIDRVDRNDKNQYVLIDYKSTGNGLTSYGSWIKNHKIQLLVYVLAMQNSWVDLPPGDVVGAFFFNIKDWERSKGLGVEGCGTDFFPEDKRKRNLLDAVALSDLVQESEILMYQQIDKMREGRLFPEPDDPDKLCIRCDWRTLCRATHLN